MSVIAGIAEPALASPLQEKQAELAAAQGRLDDLQTGIDRLTDTWAKAEQEVRSVEASLQESQEDEIAAGLELEAKKACLSERLTGYYKENHASFPMVIQIFLGSDSLTDVLNQISLLFDVVQQDRDLMDDVAALSASLVLQQEELSQRRDALEGKMAAFSITKTELTRLMEKVSRERAGLQEEVDVLVHADHLVHQAEAARRDHRGHASARTLSRASGFVFPIDGPHAFIDDWGFPRPDDRVHKGTDIMAPWGASVVAAALRHHQSCGIPHAPRPHDHLAGRRQRVPLLLRPSRSGGSRHPRG
jgi:peptidoglycan hydrolase CwlO-like protein